MHLKYLLAFTQKTLNEELSEYLSHLADPWNPVIISLVLTVVIFLIVFLAMRNSILPWMKKMADEKRLLESENHRLMALFAEMDPDPILRINSSCEIILLNPSARKSGFGELIGNPIKNILSSLNIDTEELIKENKESVFTFYFEDKYYSVLVKGISSLDIAQVYMHDITEQKTKEEALEDSKKELKEFSGYLQVKIEEERKSISRELHDNIGQKLVLLKLGLQKDIRGLTGCNDSPVFQRNSRIVEDISKDIRAVAHSLRPGTLDDSDLYSTLKKFIGTVSLQSSVKGNLDFIGVEGKLNDDLATSIYRIVQEAVNNIVKYSKAEEYSIQLIRKSTGLNLIISDAGKGFDLKKIKENKGMGIRNMRERAELHGGTFRISSAEKEGTIIMVSFPDKENK